MNKTIKQQQIIITFLSDSDLENKTLDSYRYKEGLLNAIGNKLDEMKVAYSDLSVSSDYSDYILNDIREVVINRMIDETSYWNATPEQKNAYDKANEVLDDILYEIDKRLLGE